jgi:hypothetical protein
MKVCMATAIGPVDVTITGAREAVASSETITVNRIPGRFWFTLAWSDTGRGYNPPGWYITGGHAYRTDRGGWGDPTAKMHSAAWDAALAAVATVATEPVRRAAQVEALRQDAERKRQDADEARADADALDADALSMERGADAIEAGVPF